MPLRVLSFRSAMGVWRGLSYWLRNSKAKKRIGMIEEQLPDAVELMVRSPAGSAIPFVTRRSTLVARKRSPIPLGSELGIIADEAAYGMNVDDALNRIGNMADRLDLQDLRFLADCGGYPVKHRAATWPRSSKVWPM